MKAIILAAGQGTRLKPLTNTTPKCLIEVNGEPILLNALKNLEQCGIKESLLVIGYFGSKVKTRVGEHFGRMKVTYITNKIYSQTNTSYSLWLALTSTTFREDLLILEGDVFFEKRLLSMVINTKSSAVAALQLYNPELEGTFVSLGDDGFVTDWIHSSVRPPNLTLADKYKTLNIFKFSPSSTQNVLLPALSQHVKTNQGAEPIEFVMRDLIKVGILKIQGLDVKGKKWCEIDDLRDLRRAEEIFD